MKIKIFYKLTTIILISAFIFSLGAAAAAAPISVQAAPTTATVYVNGIVPVTIEAYTIGGYNYFKLRDIATALTGSTKRFSVEWDGAANAIRLTSERIYIPIGGELTMSGNTTPVEVVPTTATVYLDGKQVIANMYAIGGYNYFKLRDIGAVMNFSVTYDGIMKAIKVNTTNEYFMPAVQEILPGSLYNQAGLQKTIRFTTDSGYIAVTEYSPIYYNISAGNITSSSDMAKLSSVFGVFVHATDQVMAGLISSQTSGQVDLQLDGKTINCIYADNTMTVGVSF